jgi:hypothetical protein
MIMRPLLRESFGSNPGKSSLLKAVQIVNFWLGIERILLRSTGPGPGQGRRTGGPRAQKRSIPKQIEFWADLGRAVERVIDMSDVLRNSGEFRGHRT